MARFVFKLHAVLRQRELVEDQKQRVLAEVRSRMTALEAQLRALDELVQNTTRDMRENRLTGQLNLEYLAAHRRFSMATQRQALHVVQQMGTLQRELDEAQLALAEAAKQRKIIEKLRDKQEQRWREALTAKELAAADEMVSQLSAREMMEQSTQ